MSKNLLAAAERIEFKNLQQWLPEYICFSLERELSDTRWTKKRLKDEPTLRYIFLSVLERYGVDCPHPWRNTLNMSGLDPTLDYSKAFECRMCRSCVIPWKPS